MDKVDTDKDDFISELELHEWIANVTRNYTLKDAETRWKVYDPENTGFVSLESIINTSYGALLACKNLNLIQLTTIIIQIIIIIMNRFMISFVII